MSHHCLIHHHWVGCRCERCGHVRDQEHDWATISCRVTCRRCGLIHALAHDLNGCICRVCGAEANDWRDNGCQRCGKIDPAWPPDSLEGPSATSWTAH